jgi:hypothetical protein
VLRQSHFVSDHVVDGGHQIQRNLQRGRKLISGWLQAETKRLKAR